MGLMSFQFQKTPLQMEIAAQTEITFKLAQLDHLINAMKIAQD